MNLLCDLCASNELEMIYAPPTTKRGLAVYVCNFCGLMQSLPRIDHVESKEVTTSSGADWGNVRYGKQFAVSDAMRILSTVLNEDGITNVLDIGAGRGFFANAYRKQYPNSNIVAIEPDAQLSENIVDANIIWNLRFEDERLELNDDYFDLVIMLHTLEHLKSPHKTITNIRHCLKLNKYLYIEVPNVEIINDETIIEEFFIDRHLYDWSFRTLKLLLMNNGFYVIHSDVNKYRIIILAKYDNERYRKNIYLYFD
jgi:SAM-dependent methyltransferase